MYSITATFSTEQAKLEGAYPIDMYVLNASLSGTDYLYYVNNNNDIYGYQLNASGDVTAIEQVYNKAVVSRDDLSSNTSGEISGISLSIPNVDRSIESVLQSNTYLRGNEVYVLTTFAPLLPSGSTAKHIGTTPDHNAVLKEKFYIDSVTSNENVVTFNCKSKFDLSKIVVPGRTFYPECQWEFKDNNCDPQASVAASWTNCNKTLEDCRLRNNLTRFGGFPSVPRKAFIVI